MINILFVFFIVILLMIIKNIQDSNKLKTININELTNPDNLWYPNLQTEDGKEIHSPCFYFSNAGNVNIGTLLKKDDENKTKFQCYGINNNQKVFYDKDFYVLLK